MVFIKAHILKRSLEVSERRCKRSIKNIAHQKQSDRMMKLLMLSYWNLRMLLEMSFFQMVLEKTVLQMTKLLKDDLSDFRVRQDGFYSEKSLFSEGRIEEACGIIKKMETLMKKMVRCGSNLQNMGMTRIAWSSERMEGLLTLHLILLTIITRRLGALTF